MGAAQNCLQDNFLNSLRETNTTVAIYLANGIKLQGRIDAFDLNVVVIKNESSAFQMVYKHAISTIMPAVAVVRSNDRPHLTKDRGKETDAEIAA